MTGVELIAAERKRQIEELNWDASNDDQYTMDDLAIAGSIYALPNDKRRIGLSGTPIGWPWTAKWWKPTPDDRIRELSKAGALIAAEIDRLQRQQQNQTNTTDNGNQQ